MLNRFIVAAIVFVSFLGFDNPAKAQSSISGQDLKEIQALEGDLVRATDSMYYAPIPDTREEFTAQFVKLLVKALKVPNSYSYSFPKLGEKINIIYPEDKSFRIFNWNIAPNDLTRRYYGAIQMEGEQLKLYPLIDYSAELGKGAADSILAAPKWFGCLYYNIITHEVNGEKVYTLLGVNSGNSISNRKVMDPMVFTDKGPVFGMPIFNMKLSNAEGRINRFVMEYKKEVQASLNYDKEIDAIYFDKLVSQVNDPNRKYTYVPSGQYDGFRWANERWNYVEDLIPVQLRKDGEAPNTNPNKKE